MKHKILYASEQEDYDAVDELIDAGWAINPLLYNGKPFILDDAIVFPMILYESDAERPVIEEARKPSEDEDVTEVKDAQHGEVAELVKQGYVVKTVYQKNTLLVKRREVKKDVV